MAEHRLSQNSEEVITESNLNETVTLYEKGADTVKQINIERCSEKIQGNCLLDTTYCQSNLCDSVIIEEYKETKLKEDSPVRDQMNRTVIVETDLNKTRNLEEITECGSSTVNASKETGNSPVPDCKSNTTIILQENAEDDNLMRVTEQNEETQECQKIMVCKSPPAEEESGNGVTQVRTLVTTPKKQQNEETPKCQEIMICKSPPAEEESDNGVTQDDSAEAEITSPPNSDDLSSDVHFFPAGKHFKMFNKLLDPEPYSPSRLALAAAFEDLKINSTCDETFLSCDNDPQPPLVEEDTAMDTSSNELNVLSENCDKVTDVNIIDLTEESDTVIPEEKNECESKNEESTPVPGECLEVSSPNNTFADTVTVSENPEIKVTAENEKDFVIVTKMIPKSRKSAGITLSEMNFGTTPSPVRKNMNKLDNDLYTEILKASPSVLDQKLPEYEKYLNLKLEINDLQQEIARLTLQVKQKEGQIIEMFPEKVRIPPRRKKSSVIEEETTSVAEVNHLNQSALLREKEEEQRKNDELKKQIDQLQQKLDSAENDLKASNEENIKLKQALTKVEEVVTKFASKLTESEDAYKREKEKLEKSRIAFDQIMERYEECKKFAAAMKAKATAYEETIKKMQLEYNLKCGGFLKENSKE